MGREKMGREKVGVRMEVMLRRKRGGGQDPLDSLAVFLLRQAPK